MDSVIAIAIHKPNPAKKGSININAAMLAGSGGDGSIPASLALAVSQ
jgi:hypothetical protein